MLAVEPTAQHPAAQATVGASPPSATMAFGDLPWGHVSCYVSASWLDLLSWVGMSHLKLFFQWFYWGYKACK
jgi:hypothetical protein